MSAASTPAPGWERCRRCRSRIPAGVSWCTLCHTPVATAVPAQRPGEQMATCPPHGDDGGSSGQAAMSALVGGQVSEHRIAEMVAELAVGESLDGGLLRPGASRSRAARALAAGIGVGVVLVAVLGILWLAGSLL